MDLSAAQHQLHHHYLNHHHHHQQQQRQQELMESQSLDSMIACSSKQPTSITHPHRDDNNSNNNNNNNTDPNPNNQNSSNPNLKPRPADSEAQRCPRCDSTNTKFCYYNNYSLSQPRYFCKACRRYWTKGGTLRNVPVGGGCRKSSSSSALTNNKRPSSPNSSFILKRAHTHHHHHHDVTPSNPTPPPPFYGSGNGYASGLTDSESSALLPNPQAFGFFDSLRQGNGGLFQSLCYGAGEAVNAPFDDGAVTMMKQENEGRALWGFPSWQPVASTSSYSYGEAGVVAAAADVEPVRGSWNGLIGNSASWHQGLLNTPALI